ncbi:MAG: energy transducer TonB [Pyrinomonadaceae bacterium]
MPEESKSSEKEANIKAQSEPTRNAENKNTGQGVGSGSGNGIGSGSGNTNQAKPPTPTNQTSALKILSKPRANYTDLARFYQITGTVPLRVTFLASGEIGSVEAIRKLPFGLTANAIAAARAIRFEPAMQDGNAYNVTKIVEYSFTIY